MNNLGSSLFFYFTSFSLLVLHLSACGSGGSSSKPDKEEKPLYSIGGTVSGAVNPGLTLENKGGDTLEVAGVSFEFPTKLVDGSGYEVTVTQAPGNQLCKTNKGKGTVSGSNITDIEILCRSWQTEQSIESSGGDALVPQIAFDSNGNALAVWHQRTGTYDNIYANTFSPDNGWGTAELIESDDSGHAKNPQIAFDQSGNAITVWSQSDGTRQNILAKPYTAESGWGTAELIESDDNGHALSPQIAIDANGNAIAVWHQFDGSRYNILANRYTPVSGWGTAEPIDINNGYNAGNAQIDFDSNGNAMVVWYQGNGSANSIYANRYTSGSGWGTAELIESNDGDAGVPQIAFDHQGNAIAVWNQDNGVEDSIYSNTYTVGSGWGTAELIESDDAGRTRSPQIAMSYNGDAMAVWEQYDGTRYNILANTYHAGKGWGTAELIENSDNDAGAPQIAFDTNGNAMAVWYQHDNTQDSIYTNTYTAGSGWGTAGLVESNHAGYAYTPQIAFDKEDRAIAVWEQYDGTRFNIDANRFE